LREGEGRERQELKESLNRCKVTSFLPVDIASSNISFIFVKSYNLGVSIGDMRSTFGGF
jgi:hypothetical protein